MILNQLQLDQNEKDMIEHIVVQMEKEGGMDRSAAMADMRFDFIEYVCERTVKKPKRVKSGSVQKRLTVFLRENGPRSLALSLSWGLSSS